MELDATEDLVERDRLQPAAERAFVPAVHRRQVRERLAADRLHEIGGGLLRAHEPAGLEADVGAQAGQVALEEDPAGLRVPGPRPLE